MARRTENYLRVPGEEKNLDVNSLNINTRSNESIVRDYILVIIPCCCVMAAAVSQGGKLNRCEVKYL